ncbi:class I SAM-dependent methyltransferase [bacterium]|nr:class I SAM-dependent methyltransferase [bacterium]
MKIALLTELVLQIYLNEGGLMFVNQKEYWNEFYSSKVFNEDLMYPSQFAAFVLGESSGINTFVEIGCGNGRDAAFFNRYGKTVFAFDNSESAILWNRRNYGNVTDLKFKVLDFTNEILDFGFDLNTNKIIYARFFIHALTDADINSFFSNCKKMMAANDQLFLEYRTEHDAKLEKVTGEHYRNFLKVVKVQEMLHTHGLKTSYSAQGLGFSKWKTDDAFVARHIVSKIDGA